MVFPVKSHLPLITTRIEFQLKELPPPPRITPRRDLGAHLRRQARHNSVPYSRPRCTSEETPVRNHRQSIGFDLRSVSPLSLMSDSGSSSDEDNGDTPNMIPKPKGEAGRSNSGGYSLKKALGWEEKRYSEFTVSYNAELAERILPSQQTFINDAVTKKLDSKRCYSKQKPADLEELVQLVSFTFN